MDVIVAQAADAKTAQTVYASELANAQNMIATNLPAGVHLNLVTSSASTASPSGSASASASGPSVGDESASVTGGATIQGKTISFTGIYAISGATFFTIGDLVLSVPPPTIAAIQAQALTLISRL